MSDRDDIGWPDMLVGWEGRQHFAVAVVDFPPRTITCKCGDIFSGPDPIAQMADHMQEGNGE